MKLVVASGKSGKAGRMPASKTGSGQLLPPSALGTPPAPSASASASPPYTIKIKKKKIKKNVYT